DLRLVLRSCKHTRISGVAWSMAEACNENMEGYCIDVAFQLDRNVFNGMASPQLVVQDLRGPDVPVH
uniref:hypothetical protein n=1 Tax=Megasphaera stantonii TaxID=2144175 RepID=UPI00130025E5